MNFMIQSLRNYSPRTVSMMTFLGCLLSGGCAGVNTSVDGHAVRLTTEEFAEYTESTFRYHNQIVNEIITAFSLSDDAMTASEVLLRAEEDMSAACWPLNEMVSATIEGREISIWAKMRLINQVPLCAEATRRVARVIPPSL